MDRPNIIECLTVLNSHNPADCNGDLNVLLDINLLESCKKCGLDGTDVKNIVQETYGCNDNGSSKRRKYISLHSYFLRQLKDSFENTSPCDVLSVQQSKSLQNSIWNFLSIGVRANLQPNMPCFRQLPSKYKNDNILDSYKTLIVSVHLLISCGKCIKLRSAVLSENLRPLLSALHQIIYCPIKKPSSRSDNGFVMTEEIYDTLLKDREKFKFDLEYISKSLPKCLYVNATMRLMEPSSPNWLKKAISKNFDDIFLSENGIETFAYTMFTPVMDSTRSYDTTNNWEALEILEKIILNYYKKEDFQNIICKQLTNFLEIKDSENKSVIIFEDLFCLCLKRLFLMDNTLCERTLLPVVFDRLNRFSLETHKFSIDENLTEFVSQITRLLHSCFIGRRLHTRDLPLILLEPVINIIGHLYTASLESSHNELRNNLEDIFVKCMKNCRDVQDVYDCFLFDFPNDNIFAIRRDVYLDFSREEIIVKTTETKSKSSIVKKSAALVKLCKRNESLYFSLFLYFLKVSTEKEKYFKAYSNRDLLNTEDEAALDETTQRKLTVYQTIAQLAEDSLIQDYVGENPERMVDYLGNTLTKAFESKLHETQNQESEDFQTVFTLAMILHALVTTDGENVVHFKNLENVVNAIYLDTVNFELKNLLKSIVDVLSGGKFESRERKNVVRTELDKAIEEICDPLLPVRGHGLMTLVTLVEGKDEDAMERKNYILNIFQQNLKNEDTFIYRAAIAGLAALGDVFPDTVLRVLTDEYSDFGKKDSEDGNELRMKLGESLLRITKRLGDMAPKYKSLLLNTFLVGAKDEDDLMRASSLSNLGEICRVLGYKLGSIVIEVLVCVHSIVSTDKAAEARRAAVTVIRQLLAGLESDMVVFLKDHILEVYRTLKNIYYNDQDDVMRLQAQLALEELNENVKNFVLPKPTLHFDKKIIMLN